MDPNIEQAWEAVLKRQEEISHQWRTHANRRTFAILLALCVPFVAVYMTALRAPSDFPTGEIVSIEPAQTAEEIAWNLEEMKVVRSGPALELILRVMGGDRTIHASDYQFTRSRNAFRIARALATGDFGLEPVRVHIPAGSTIEQMATILDKRLARFDREEFLEKALPFEGYLYPDTYFFLPIARPDLIIGTMRDTFERKVATIQEEITASGHTLEEVVVMASILEREENEYLDKQKISGLLWKRLEINMPLQVDATFVYVIGKGSHQLTLEDLQYDSPYNTYRNKGLPPGPIAAPSIDSLRAAVLPIKSNNLFYLADDSGTTHYSATYEEHMRKRRYYFGP